MRLCGCAGLCAPSDAAFTRNVLVVSKLICKYGDAHSFMPMRLMGKYDPVRVMKSAIKLKCLAFTSMPYTANTPTQKLIVVLVVGGCVGARRSIRDHIPRTMESVKAMITCRT